MKYGVNNKVKQYLISFLGLLLISYFGLNWYGILLFVIGILSSISALIYVVLFTKVEKKVEKVVEPQIETSHRLEFLLKVPDLLNEPLFPSSPSCSESLDDFIELIINQFIDSWYVKISSSPRFRNVVKLEIYHLTRSIKQRLVGVNFSKLLVSKLLPILTNHFQNSLKLDNTKLDDLEIAKLFPLHPGVTIKLLDPVNFREKIFLKSKFNRILPLILSENESGTSNNLLPLLLAEILADSVFLGMFNMISESDFYNVLITQLIGQNLKHRGQVKQLRAALEEFTVKAPTKSKELINNSSLYILSEHLNNVAFQAICNTVNDIADIIELDTVQRSIESQLKMKSNSIKLNHRLKKLKKIVDKKYSQLKNVEYDFSDILNNKFQLFSEFMDYRKRLTILQCWRDIESTKAPLDSEDLAVSLEFQSVLDFENIYTRYFEDNLIQILSEAKTVLTSLSQNSDVNTYRESRQIILDIQHKLYQEMLAVDFPLFQGSGFLTKITPKNPTRKTSLMLLNQVTQEDTGLSQKNEDDVSPVVIQAVEDAFTEIMKNPIVQHGDINDIRLASKRDIFLSEDRTDNLFDDEFEFEEKMFNNTPNSDIGSIYSQSIHSSIEQLTSKSESKIDLSVDKNLDLTISNPMMDSIELEEKFDGSQVFLAGPGDLSLAEEINKLSQEIDKLNEQLTLLIPLLKKASLVNNIGEIKILKKSKTSLETELKYKELQLQQYVVQENDNSLFGKSTVTIQSYVVGNDEKQKGKEFILYIMEVQKFGDTPDQITAGWVVARRYSQFHKLNEYLCSKYKKVTGLKFPKRSVLTPQRQLVETRKSQLEEYIRKLIEIPQVCSDKIFRSFLSSENFNLRNNFETKTNEKKSNSDIFIGKIYNLGEKFSMKNNNQQVITENLKEMQNELKTFDNTSKGAFVKPICNLLISVFKLTHSQSWLRGRALIVILQQLFGTTIENMVYQQVDKRVRDEIVIDELINKVKGIVFPNGKFKEPPIVRSVHERSATKKEARVILTIYMHETCSKIFGTSNSNYASTKIFQMLQNDYLNKSLIFKIFDALVEEIFPELSQDRLNQF